MAHRTRVAALALLALACERSEPESNLEKMAEAEEAARRDAFEFVNLAEAGPPPAGVEASLWSDVGWFPADIVGISPMHGEQLPFVTWLRRNLEDFGSDCTAVLDGIERYYMVGHPDTTTSQTLVFYGTLDRMRIEDCARSTLAKAAPRVTVVSQGALTRIGEGEDAQFIGWLARGHEVIAIYDRSRRHVDSMLGGGDTLESNTLWVDMLRDPPAGSLTSMGLRDFADAFLQVPSVGYSVAPVALTEPVEMRANLHFADEATARRAGVEADSLISELEAAGLGAGQLVNEGVEGSRLRFRMKVDFELMNASETKLRPLVEVLSKRRVKAGMEPIDVAQVVELLGQAKKR